MESRKSHVNTVEAKNSFNKLVAQAIETKEPIVVEKRGEPVAVILDYESYRQGKESKTTEGDLTLVEELKAFHRRMKKKYPKGTGDSVEILREAREERSRRL